MLLAAELAGGWGLALAFSPGGATLAAASQGSALTLLTGIDLAEEDTWRAAAGRLQTLALPGLPLKALAFVDEDLLVGGGFDCRPLVFRRDPGTGAWAFDRHLQGLRPGGAAGGRLADRVKLFEAAQVCVRVGGGWGLTRMRRQARKSSHALAHRHPPPP